MRIFRFIAVLAITFSALRSSSQLLTWNTFGNLGTETSELSVSNNTNIGSSTLTLGAGLTAAANGNRFGGSGWWDTGNTAGGNTIAQAIAGNNYIQFIVTPNSGFSFTPTSLVFSWDKSGTTGPLNVALRSSADSYATDLGTVTGITAGAFATNTITISGLTNLTSATTFRIYGYGATATGGTGGFDVGSNIVNVTLNGSTASTGITSAQDGPWTTTTTWVGGVVPTAANNVIIAHNVTAAAQTRNIGTTTTINTGASLAVSGTYTNNGTTTVNGTFQLNAGGWATGSNFAYGAAGTLNFNNTGSYGVNNTDVFWPTTAGPFNVNVLQGGVTMNSASRTVAGTFATAAGVILTSSTLTLNGTCQLNSGGFFNQSPIYGSASTLIYNTGGTYVTSNEWTGGATTAVAAGSGVPNNVIAQNNTNVTLAGGRGCAGNMTISSGSVLTLNASSGDFYIAGNLLQNGGSGGLINNNRAVFFVGSAATQTISATGGTVFFDYFIISKSAGTVQISSAVPTNVTINNTSGDVFRIVNTGTLDLNGRTLTLNNNGGNILATGGARTITSSVSGGTVAIAGQKTCLFSSGSITFDTNVTVLLTNGINFGASSTLLGTLQINAGGYVTTNSCTYGSASLLTYNTGSAYNGGTEWTGGAVNTVAAGLGIPANVTVQTSGTNVTLAGGRGIPGNLIVSTGATFTLNGTGGDFYTLGNMTFTGTGAFNGNNRAVFFCKNGTQVVTSAAAITIPYIVFSPASGASTVQLGTGTSLTASAPNTGNAISFSSATDKIDLNGQSLSIGSASTANTISGSGTFSGSATSNLTLLGTGNIGTLNFTTGAQSLNNFTMNRTTSGAATLGTALTINGAGTFTNGILTLGSNHLTFGAAATATSGSTGFVAADGTGEVRKTFTANGAFTYPVGDNSAPDGAQYSPATLTFSAGTYSSAYAGIRVVDLIQPNNEATVNYITRYWAISSSGITSPTYAFSGTYTAADIVGTEATSIAGRWNGTTWITGSAIGSNTVSLSGQTTLTATNHVSAGAPLIRAEMNVKQAAVAYVTGSTYNFGSAAGGSNVDVVFTIENLGLENLNLSSATVTGAEYSLFANYSSPVTSGSTTTFTIRFTPTGSGTYTGNISIPNNDPDDSENPYVINFTGVGTGSASSNVVFNSGASASTNSNIAYASYQAASITAIGDAVGVMGFTLQDGGGSADADALPTILNAISFSVTNVANIRSAAIFNGSTLVAAATVNGTSPIVFTGMSGSNVTASDDGSLNLALHITFQSTVTDNQKMVFTVSSVTAASGGTSSLFAAANGGGAVSENTAGDINRIEVTADRLAFVQQPTSGSINVSMSPAVTVEGEDALGNRDLDFAGTVNITSSGTLTGSPVGASASSGLATYSTLQHSVGGTGLTLTAASSGLTSATSTTFDMSSLVNGEYRTTSAGTWTSTGGTATWERVVSGVWTANAAPAFNVTNMVYIRHAISITGSASPSKLTIENSGTLTNASSCTYGATSLLVENGGAIVANAPLTVAGLFDVMDGGTVTLNFVAASNSPIWNGTENFRPNSTFIIKNSSGTATTAFYNGTAVSSNTYSGYTAAFGNITFDYAAAAIGVTTIVTPGTTGNICHGDFTLLTSPGGTLTICGTGTISIGVGGDFLIPTTWGNTDVIQFKTSGTLDFTIEGSYLQEAGTVRLTTSTTASTAYTMAVKGDMYLLTGGIYEMGQNITANAVSSIVNLAGDLVVDAASSLQRNNNNNALGFFNFNGTGNGTSAALTQSIDNASTATLENRNINFVVKNGAYAKIENRDLQLGNNSKLTVESGGSMDFGLNGSTSYLVTEVSAGATTTVFDLQSGGTAITANTVGLQSSGATGSVQLDTRTYSSGANYVFNGTVAQTVSGITTTPTANTIASITTNNAAGANLAQDFTVTSTILKNGVFSMGTNNLTSSNTTGSNTFSATNMISTPSTGAFALVVPTGTGSYLYPLGDVSGTAEYSPITLNFSANSIQRNIGMRVSDAAHPQINNPTTAAVSISRYWSASTSTTTGTYAYTAAMTYLAADVSGTESNLWAAGYNGSWNSYQGSLSSPVLTSASINETNAPINGMDLTGRRISDGAAPVITYTTVSNQCSVADQSITATITDELGLPNIPSLATSTVRPRIYFRKNSGTWFSAAGTYISGTPTNSSWSFTISNATMGGATTSDVIQYYIIAQDVSVPINIDSNPAGGLVATDVNTVSTHPTTPNSFVFNPRPTGTISGTTAICAGSSTNLTLTVTGSGTISGTLSNGLSFSGTAPTITVSVSPGSTTTFTIATLSDSNCSATSGDLSGSAVVTVNPILTPSVSIAASPSTTICAGDNVTFTATPVNGGTTPSYQWYIGATPVGTNSATFSTTGLTNGNAVSVVMTNNAVCPSSATSTSNTITMSVNSISSVSVSIAEDVPSPICAGTSVTFTATPTNGGTTPSYQWYIGATPVGTNSPTFTTTSLANGNSVTVQMTSNAVCPVPTTATSNAIVYTVTAAPTWYLDSDGDGYGSGATTTSCTQPVGYVLSSSLIATTGDCNDAVEDIYPGADEWCNSTDDDCDSSIDEGLASTFYYQDLDGDGYRSAFVFIFACTQPAGYLPGSASIDCNDTNAGVYPGTIEVCENGIDDNCNSIIDENCTPGPINDFKYAALPIATNNIGTCTGVSGTLAGATASAEALSSCVTGQDVWYYFNATSEAAAIKCTSSLNNILIELQTEEGVLVETENVQSIIGNETMNTAAVVPGNTYYVIIRNFNSAQGAGGAFNVCVQNINASSVDIPVSNPSAQYARCGSFKADYTAANQYVFHFGSSIQYTTPNSGTTISLANISGLTFSTNYSVTIDAVYNLVNGAGAADVLTVPGAIATNIYINAQPDLDLRSQDTAPSTKPIYSYISTNQFLCSVVSYNWSFQRVTSADVTIGLPIIVNSVTSSRYLQINGTNIPGVAQDRYYRVMIQPVFSSGPGLWYTDYQILHITPSGGMVLEESNTELEQTLMEKDMNGENFATIYPNPNNGQYCGLNVVNIVEGTTQVRIMNNIGQMVYTNRFATGEGVFNTAIVFEQELANGLYMVEITLADKSIITERMVVAD
jgi:hypothetical protein